MVSKDVVTDSVTLHISYSHSWEFYALTPPAHGSIKLAQRTSSDILWREAIEKKYNAIVRPDAPIRRITISCNNILKAEEAGGYQYSMFDEDGNFCLDGNINKALAKQDKSVELQKAIINLKKKFGKNSVLKGMNLQSASTMRERNRQIGGHRSGE